MLIETPNYHVQSCKNVLPSLFSMINPVRSSFSFSLDQLVAFFSTLQEKQIKTERTLNSWIVHLIYQISYKPDALVSRSHGCCSWWWILVEICQVARWSSFKMANMTANLNIRMNDFGFQNEKISALNFISICQLFGRNWQFNNFLL